ncbi:MAG: hypothetical protein HUJ63_06300 [Enterococcus sp.]|nr:hypothetical protein [Enterococcus sp.]
MKYRFYGHRDADYLFPNKPEFKFLWNEIRDCLDAVSEEMIISTFQHSTRKAKSISEAINKLLKEEFIKKGWNSESYIFADEEYARKSKGTWRLDFAKDKLSVEVAFNHRSDISWNLIKPTLASELNHVDKAIQTSGGVIITATENMKRDGGFDSACGTYEDYVQYLRPMSLMLTAPLMIVGLEATESFKIEKMKESGRTFGVVVETIDF